MNKSKHPSNQEIEDGEKLRHSKASANKTRNEMTYAINDSVERKQQSINIAISGVRGSIVTFVVFGFYLAVIFGGTGHGQLLLEEKISLPILEVNLPLVAFYVLSPIIFIMLHLNVLINLLFLSQKIWSLNLSVNKSSDKDQKEEWINLHSFPIVQILARKDLSKFVQYLVLILMWSIIVVFPLCVLALCQIQFLPYHNAMITWMHRILVSIDLLLIWFLWIDVLNPRRNNTVQDRFLKKLSRAVFKKSPRRTLKSALLYSGWALSRNGAKPFTFIAILYTCMCWLIAVVPDSFLAKPLDTLIGPEKSVVGVSRNLRPNTALPGRALSPELIEQMGGDFAKAFHKYADWLELSDRDLRYADFTLADLSKARFGPNTNLHKAKLDGTRLQGSVFYKTDLTEVDLYDTDLSGAHLIGVQLQSKVLRDVKLRGASLQEAKLQGADLSSVDLTGANLFRTDLRGTILRFSKLIGADLTCADLAGATLRDADVRGAVFDGANMRAANFENAKMWRASFEERICRRSMSPKREHVLAAAQFPGVTFDPLERPQEVFDKFDGALTNDEASTRLAEALVSPERMSVDQDFMTLNEASDMIYSEENEVALAEVLGDLACGEESDLHTTTGVRRRLDGDSSDSRRFLDRPPSKRLHAKIVVKRLLCDCQHVSWSAEEEKSLRLSAFLSPQEQICSHTEHPS